MILDTNFIIDLDSRKQAARQKAREIERQNRPRRVPHPVIAELWVSVGFGGSTVQNKRRLRQTLRGLPRVGLTEQIAKRGGRIQGEAMANDPNGSGVGLEDAYIAATALEYDEPVVTDNTTDFVNRIQQNLGYSGLDVETY